MPYRWHTFEGRTCICNAPNNPSHIVQEIRHINRNDSDFIVGAFPTCWVALNACYVKKTLTLYHRSFSFSVDFFFFKYHHSSTVSVINIPVDSKAQKSSLEVRVPHMLFLLIDQLQQIYYWIENCQIITRYDHCSNIHMKIMAIIPMK